MSAAARNVHIALITLGCFGGGSLYGWSGFLPAVRSGLVVGNAAASMVFSLALVFFTLGVLLGPMLFARAPLRARLPLIAGLAVVSLGLSAASTGLTGFALAYGAGFGFASGAFYNHAVSQASAMASAMVFVPVSVAAFGLGGAVFGPVHLWLGTAGWGLWSVLPAMVCLAAVAVLSLVVPAPPDSVPAPRRARLVAPDRTVARIWVIFAAGSCSGLIVLGFAAQIVPQGGGLAGLAVFLAALGNTLGRLSSALSAGRFGPARGIAGASILSMGALAGLILETAPGVTVALLFLVAFAYGQLAATTPLLVRSLVSPTVFAGSFGWVFTGWGVAGLLGPWTAGWLLDATGTLRFALIACIALAGLSLVLVLRFAASDRAAKPC